MDRALDIQTLISAVEAKKGETCSMSKLKEFAPMLKDYFSIGIEQDENGKWVLRALPLLISDYEPFYGYLPLFLFNLCTQVHYTNEKQCLDEIARELSDEISEEERLKAEEAQGSAGMDESSARLL